MSPCPLRHEETFPAYAILSDPSFWPFLLRLDEDLAAEVRAACCSHCGAPLHSALGMLPDTRYEETVVQLEARDTLLLFTDGATEIVGGHESALSADGLQRLARAQTGGEDPANFHVELLEQQLLQFSDQIHLPDDLTLVKLGRLH